MVQSDESIKANIASYIGHSEGKVLNDTTLNMMVEYIKEIRVVGEDEELVEPYGVIVVIALNDPNYDLASEVSFYEDMYDHMNYVVHKLKGGV